MRFAVVFKTYSWDGFIERQAERYAAAAEGGDFFISYDETNSACPPVQFERVVRTSNAKLIAAGLADRFEQGSLIWWNADYPQYTFYEQHPGYDYYVFVEYDSMIQAPIGALVAAVAASGADFVAEPIVEAMESWWWSARHRPTYAAGEIRGSLNCISIFTPRALALLGAVRRRMGGERVGYWPLSEVFVATEIHRAGLVARPLSQFGDVSGYAWFPPFLEEDVPLQTGRTFLHPVLDPPRYVALTLKSNAPPLAFLWPSSRERRLLARLPASSYRHLLWPAAMRRLRIKVAEWRERRWPVTGRAALP